MCFAMSPSLNERFAVKNLIGESPHRRSGRYQGIPLDATRSTKPRSLTIPQLPGPSKRSGSGALDSVACRCRSGGDIRRGVDHPERPRGRDVIAGEEPGRVPAGGLERIQIPDISKIGLDGRGGTGKRSQPPRDPPPPCFNPLARSSSTRRPGEREVVEQTGLKPATSSLRTRRSIS